MKTFTYILSLIALVLVIYNITQVNFKAPFEEESIIALITVVAGLCTILLLAILRVSKKIEAKQRRRS